MKTNEKFEQTTQTIDALAGEITYLNAQYRAGNPQASDEYYDSLLARLSSLDPTHLLLQKGIIETARSNPRMRRLPVRMMSLNKEKTFDNLMLWIENIGLKADDVLVVSPKFNGISLVADLKTKQASTRGDGEYGQNCDPHFDLINARVHRNFDHICSGEAIISRRNWAEHFVGKISPSGTPYKLNNATVAGLLNCDDPTEALKHVDFVKYTLHETTMHKSQQLKYMNMNTEGLWTDYLVVTVGELSENMLDKFFHRANSVYPIDGLVIDVDDYDIREGLGREMNGNPAFARALKLDRWVEEFDTVITGYVLNISKQGKLKGAVTFEPVFINGCDVKQATFYNAQFLHDFALCPGVKVTIKKSGEVIPKIVAVEGVRIPLRVDYKSQQTYDIAFINAAENVNNIVDNSNINFPHYLFDICSSCRQPMSWDKNKVDLECKNFDCRDRRISKIEHFLQSLGVEEMGRPSVEKLYDAGYDSIHKLWNITAIAMMNVGGFGESSVDIFLKQVDAIKRGGVPLARLMYAMDLFDGTIGEKTAQQIFDSVDADYLIDKKELLKVKGVSDITADCFIRAYDRIEELIGLNISIAYAKSPAKELKGSRFSGFAVCFSGVRDKSLEEEIESQGGKIASGVSKTTTHLVVADPSQGTSKTVKARELNIPILTIEQFKQL